MIINYKTFLNIIIYKIPCETINTTSRLLSTGEYLQMMLLWIRPLFPAPNPPPFYSKDVIFGRGFAVQIHTGATFESAPTALLCSIPEMTQSQEFPREWMRKVSSTQGRRRIKDTLNCCQPFIVRCPRRWRALGSDEILQGPCMKVMGNRCQHRMPWGFPFVSRTPQK